MLDQVKAGRIILGEAGRGVLESQSNNLQIEAPYLQLVMQRLWDVERSDKSHTLRLETLNRLGGAESIIRSHLSTMMNSLSPEEQEYAARVFRFLVTPSGNKIAI